MGKQRPKRSGLAIWSVPITTKVDSVKHLVLSPSGFDQTDKVQVHVWRQCLQVPAQRRL